MEVMYLFLHWRRELNMITLTHVNSCTAVIHDMITRDLERLWHDNCMICSYDVTGADFEILLYAFGQSEKS